MVEKWMEYFQVPAEMDLMISLAAKDAELAPMDGIDWKRFGELAAKNRLEPLIAAGTKKIPEEPVRQISELENFLSAKNSFTLFSMRQVRTLALILSDFNRYGIRALSIKGPLLAVELYGSPELRYSHDLDILVSESDFSKACARLEANGFREEITALNKTSKRRRTLKKSMGIIHAIYLRGDMCVELHWKLSHRMQESFEELWERRSQKKLLGQTVCCLGELDNLSYLICHAAGHGYMRMRWLFDLYVLLRRPDVNWKALYEDMVRKGIQGMLLETLILLYRCPRFVMPALENSLFSIGRENGQVKLSYKEDLQADYEYGAALAEAVWPMLLMTDEERQASTLGRRYGALLPVAGKKQSCFEVLVSFFQPSAFELGRFDFPDSLYFLYYVVRPFYRLWRMTPFYHPKAR